MIGLVRKSAHVCGANIEKMIRIRGAVSDTTADIPTLLDEKDLNIRGWITQQMIR
jgi:hypothetical protein